LCLIGINPDSTGKLLQKIKKEKRLSLLGFTDFKKKCFAVLLSPIYRLKLAFRAFAVPALTLLVMPS
jgi:hypothetical protein